MISFPRPLLVAASLVLAAPAFAQQQPETPPEPRGGDFVIAGAGAAVMPDYEGSDDYRWAPIPAAVGRVSGFGFQFVGNRLSVDLIPDRPGPGWDLQLGPVAVLNLNRSSTRSIEDPRVKALGKVGTAVELGGYAGIGRAGVLTSDYDRLSVTISYRHDVTGTHDSGVLTPAVSYMTPLSRKALVGVFANAERVGDGYARTYFGVPAEAAPASGLAAYDLDGGWKSWTLGLGGAVSLSGDLTHGLQLVGGGTYRRMLGDFADSPLVATAGSRGQWMGMLGLAYSF
ncbi:MAG: MipA/OmpV family protein [Sphingomonas sp.]|uniref:MipA/OmpV family protein n=1 Tax=Sphingomonas sp. TaxID=28214 RepID=UPI001B18237F|nr:MipA/OmpV family protein [Sphingomonas sp.]MBO9622223.1 MipA/OmpV family protein [Sphingomonas sp.]